MSDERENLDEIFNKLSQMKRPRVPLGLLLPLLAVLLVLVVFFATLRIGRVTGEEVGVLLDKMTGEIEVIPQSGVRFYNGITSDFFVLDKTLQTLEMTSAAGRGDRGEKDDLKVKTGDGSDVYVDIKVQYRIDPAMAETVIRTSGPGGAFKEKWARDYVRAICRNALGELKTDDFYDAGKRNAKMVQAQRVIGERLADFGIRIDNILIPTRPRFYKEYEEIIKQKKLADQEVLAEQSKARAAEQAQLRKIVEETNVKNVAVEKFKGEMEQRIIDAEAQAERARKEADAYYDRVTIGAEAQLYEHRQEAEGILAKRQAEAQGIDALRKALEGPGGRNMVKLEYARKLKGVTVTGQPYTLQSETLRFKHSAEEAAAAPKPAARAKGGAQ
jgi:regulator of protease activity HflC (stomatin/prohibitin superfamily)